MGPTRDDFDEDEGATQGMDLLGLALGRGAGPGATDLDDFVDFEVYYDGAVQAAQVGEAAAFLRAKLCEAFDLLSSDLSKYLWHRDRFCLEVNLGDSSGQDEPHLMGHLRIGDGAEDGWFVVYLLRRLTTVLPGTACRVTDADGEFLLIEAALEAPRWLTPANAENRCWIVGGAVHLLPRPRPPEPQKMQLRQALARLRAASGASVAKGKVQQAINSRLEGYPRRAVELSCHVARAVLPRLVAQMLCAYPQLVGIAVDHLPLPPARELLRLRRQLHGAEAEVHLDCEASPEEDTVCVGVRFTRCQYARLLGLRCQLPQRFTGKHWKPPRAIAVEDKAMQLGATLCAGLEAAYLQGTKSATAVLRWPSHETWADVLLPATVPWWPDATFALHMEAVRSPITPASPSARRAFLQQDRLDERFQTAFLRALRCKTLDGAVDLSSHWRDCNDAEGWLHVSAEELDTEMQARQADFDNYDRRCQDTRAAKGRSAGDSDKRNPEELHKELAAMGQELSGLLGRASCLDGVDAGGSAGKAEQDGCAAADSDSEGSGSGELDVLGMEDDDSSSSSNDGGRQDGPGSLHEYMAELDEQLEGAFGDAGLQEPEEHLPTAGGLPLSSRHVKVHGVGALELDVHAMEHILASYCSEHQLEPGPASLLLGELGLAGRGLVPPPVPPQAVPGLDTMD